MYILQRAVDGSFTAGEEETGAGYRKRTLKRKFKAGKSNSRLLINIHGAC
jgi:hypothetical protein